MSSDIEDIFTSLGSFGRYQKYIFAVACLFSFIGSPTIVQTPFTAYQKDYRCFVPSCDSSNNTSYNESFVEFAIPSEDGEYDSCSLYDSNNSSTCKPENFDQSQLINCSHWVYDDDIFKTTIISDFNLVCDRSWLSSISSSVFMFGNLVGSVICGAFSDRFGRKPTLMVSIISFLIIGVGCSWVNNYILYLVLRFLTGVAGMALFPTAFILAVEYIGPDWRTFAGMMVQIPFALGEAYTGVAAYFIRDWRWLQTSLILPAILLIPLYWVMSESVLWLLSKGKIDDAFKIVHKAAKVNKVTLPPRLYTDIKLKLSGEDYKELKGGQDEIDNLEGGDVAVKKISVLDIMRYKKLRIRTLILFYCWAVSSMSYYGLSSNTGNMSGNIFVNFILTMLIEIPSYIASYLLLDRIGRKGTMILFFLIGGFSCITSGILPSEYSMAIVTFSIFGKFGVTAAFGSIYVYTAELYPTEIRNLSVGLCAMSSRIGGVLAPLIAGLNSIYTPLPLLIFGFSALIAGVLHLFLPETCGTNLPQTIEQSEQFGDDSIWYFICFDKKRQQSKKKEDVEILES